jgi:hypothetical protein
MITERVGERERESLMLTTIMVHFISHLKLVLCVVYDESEGSWKENEGGFKEHCERVRENLFGVEMSYKIISETK